MKRFLLTTLLAFCICGVSWPAWGNIYYWVDEAGTTHFTNTMPSPEVAEQVKIITCPAPTANPDEAQNVDQGQSAVEDQGSAQVLTPQDMTEEHPEVFDDEPQNEDLSPDAKVADGKAPDALLEDYADAYVEDEPAYDDEDHRGYASSGFYYYYPSVYPYKRYYHHKKHRHHKHSSIHRKRYHRQHKHSSIHKKRHHLGRKHLQPHSKFIHKNFPRSQHKKKHAFKSRSLLPNPRGIHIERHRPQRHGHKKHIGRHPGRPGYRSGHCAGRRC